MNCSNLIIFDQSLYNAGWNIHADQCTDRVELNAKQVIKTSAPLHVTYHGGNA